MEIQPRAQACWGTLRQSPWNLPARLPRNLMSYHRVTTHSCDSVSAYTLTLQATDFSHIDKLSAVVQLFFEGYSSLKTVETHQDMFKVTPLTTV